jgi:ABC-type polysaccharide/polyol phosphate transport system ATPase subunit
MAFITVDSLTVEFAVYGTNARSLKNAVLSQATGGRVMAGARDVVSVRAIDNLHLHVKDGDRIGLVGHNGSGKTTLLRVLAGIYKPTAGRVTIKGQVRTLLDASAGTDPSATGLENIYLRGYVLGLTKREIDNLVDDIADFTELGDFLRLPMRTYSAGMAARLAFAISTSVHSDILLIDEGIGAGDAEFQVRARQRIESLFAKTSIVILASHAQDLIDRFCNRTIQMDHGRKVRDEGLRKGQGLVAQGSVN